MICQVHKSISAISRRFLALFASVAVVGLTAPANASIQLEVSADNTTYSTLTLTAVPMMSGQYSYTNSALAIGGINFDVNFLLTTNSPGTPTLAELIDLETSIRQNGAGGGNRNVYIRATDDTFMEPVGSDLTLNSKLEFISQSQGGPGGRTLTSTFIGDSMQTIGPHDFGTGTPLTFNSTGTPFTLQNVTFVFLTPNEGVTTKSTTWLTRAADDDDDDDGGPPVGGAVPELPSSLVWTCLAAVCGLGVKYRRTIG